MANLDHEAIRKAYPNAVTIDDTTGAVDINGDAITLVQSDVDAARTTLDTEDVAVKYKTDRLDEYPSYAEQFDLIYHSGVDAWKAKIKETKDKYPKPS